MKQTDKNKNLHIIEGVIAIVLLAGIVWFLTSGHQVTAPSTNEPITQNTETKPTNPMIPTKEPATNTPSGKDVIVVSTQIKGSKAVTVDNATLSKPGFIVINTLGPSNNPATILGTSKLLTAGSKQDLEISLGSNKLVAGTEYTAEIYQDDGDKKFNPTKDKLASGSNSTFLFQVK